MKKFLLVLLILALPGCAYSKSYLDSQLKNVKKSVKYNSVQTLKKNYVESSNIKVNKKSIQDPKLLKLSDFQRVNDDLYRAKLAKDDKIYEKEVLPVFKKKISTYTDETLPVDFYNLYRISEKLIRANNLEYVNWRIAVRKTDDPNASSANANYIVINTALYDTFYNNEDALAYIIAHEMSHLILGHIKQQEDLITKVENAQYRFRSSSITYKALMMKYMKEMRDMEYMADAEAITLISKAGYSPQKAISALNTMDTYGEVKFLRGIYNTHPDTSKRIESFKENMSVMNPEWVEEGKSNIYNSEVLSVKKSSDRVSFVIDKSSDVNKFYQVENLEERLKRLAYASYLNGNYSNAIKYFEKLSQMDEKDYVPYVYLSLSNWELYCSLNETSYKTRAIKNIDKALEINSSDVVKNISKDIKDNL